MTSEETLAKINRNIEARKSFQPGDELWWYRSFRNDVGWQRPVTFVRYAGKTRALVVAPGGQEHRVPVDSLSRER